MRACQRTPREERAEPSAGHEPSAGRRALSLRQSPFEDRSLQSETCVLQHDLQSLGVTERTLIGEIVRVEHRHHLAATLEGSQVGLGGRRAAEPNGLR